MTEPTDTPPADETPTDPALPDDPAVQAEEIIDDTTPDDSTPDQPDVNYTPKRRKRTPTPPPPPPLQLLEQRCPGACEGGQILTFDQSMGQFINTECERCLGVGTIEVQVASE